MKKKISDFLKKIGRRLIFQFEEMTFAESIILDQILITGQVKSVKELRRGKKYDNIPLTGISWWYFFLLRTLDFIGSLMKNVLPVIYVTLGEYSFAGFIFTSSWIIHMMSYAFYAHFHYRYRIK